MDQPNAGAGQPDSPSGGNAAPANGSDGIGGNWASGLNEDSRAIVEREGWKSGDDAVRDYSSLKKVLSETARLPAKDAKPEDWEKFFAKVRPDKPELYEFKLPDKLPEQFPYDKEFADEWRQWGHEAGLHPMQAQKLHDKYVAKMADVFGKSASDSAARQAAEDKAVGDAHAALVKEWGPPDAATYKENVSYVDRLVNQEAGLMDAFKGSGFLAEDGAVKNPVILKTLAKWAKQLVAEDTLHKGEQSRGVNPWHNDTINLSAQAKLIESDPNRARELIRAAGKDPARWQL